jgi:hypothetical protein
MRPWQRLTMMRETISSPQQRKYIWISPGKASSKSCRYPGLSRGKVSPI